MQFCFTRFFILALQSNFLPLHGFLSKSQYIHTFHDFVLRGFSQKTKKRINGELSVGIYSTFQTVHVEKLKASVRFKSHIKQRYYIFHHV